MMYNVCVLQQQLVRILVQTNLIDSSTKTHFGDSYSRISFDGSDYHLLLILHSVTSNNLCANERLLGILYTHSSRVTLELAR
jgi:hypothetical protein